MQRQKSQSLVYLIHFDQPYRHARHYLGTTIDLPYRLWQHASGTRAGGARLMEVIIQAGITWRVAGTWLGGRELEQRLKGWNNSGRFCPICKAERLAGQIFETVAETDSNWLA